MDTYVSKLTILFEAPFWIGLYERESDGRYEVCKITFGAEPKQQEIYDFIIKQWKTLHFSPSLAVQNSAPRKTNPKRVQRDIHREVDRAEIGTKAQQALKLQQQEGKQARKIRFRQEREALAQQQFDLRQEKRREKHKGH